MSAFRLFTEKFYPNFTLCPDVFVAAGALVGKTDWVSFPAAPGHNSSTIRGRPESLEPVAAGSTIHSLKLLDRDRVQWFGAVDFLNGTAVFSKEKKNQLVPFLIWRKGYSFDYSHPCFSKYSQEAMESALAYLEQKNESEMVQFVFDLAGFDQAGYDWLRQIIEITIERLEHKERLFPTRFLATVINACEELPHRLPIDFCLAKLYFLLQKDLGEFNLDKGGLERADKWPITEILQLQILRDLLKSSSLSTVLDEMRKKATEEGGDELLQQLEQQLNLIRRENEPDLLQVSSH